MRDGPTRATWWPNRPNDIWWPIWPNDIMRTVVGGEIIPAIQTKGLGSSGVSSLYCHVRFDQLLDIRVPHFAIRTVQTEMLWIAGAAPMMARRGSPLWMGLGVRYAFPCVQRLRPGRVPRAVRDILPHHPEDIERGTPNRFMLRARRSHFPTLSYVVLTTKREPMIVVSQSNLQNLPRKRFSSARPAVSTTPSKET